MFLDRPKEIERALNRIRIEPNIGLGEFIGLYIVLLQRRGLSFRLVLSSIRDWILPSKIQGYLYQPPNAETQAERQEILIVAADFTDRLTGFYNGILAHQGFNINVTSSSKVTGDKFDLREQVEFPKIRLPINYVWQIWNTKGISFMEKLICVGAMSVQWRKFGFWKRKINIDGYQMILTDLDRYPSNVPVILAARSLGVKTITLVHGSINPIANYIPVLASHMFVWGKYHADRFSESNSNDLNIHVVGNPKIKKVEVSIKPALTTIGLGMTKLKKAQRAELINLFLEGTEGFINRFIKIHPKESIDEYLSEISHKESVKILDNYHKADDFLSRIDVLCIRRSQLGSDALSYNIPIIVIDGIDPNDLQNGALLNKYAGCPIVQNKFELFKELELLKRDSIYRKKRLDDQNVFLDLLYSYTGLESEKIMIDTTKTLLKK